MSGRPILFSAPMVRAILEGRKTQTRRVLKPHPELVLRTSGRYWTHPKFPGGYPAEVLKAKADRLGVARYATGDRLWVRERAHIDGQEVNYAANLHPELDLSGLGFHPSIHMPRWASRITLIVEAVKVERLQDISEADARAEGIFARGAIGDDPTSSQWTWQKDGWRYDTSREAFQALWKSINGPGSWADNPWVTAITFRPVFKNIDQVRA